MKSISDAISESEAAQGLLAEAEKAKAFREQLAEERKEDEDKKQQPGRIPAAPLSPRARGLVEVVRSFSYKLNAGNYESRDFFCSQKIECYADEADALSAQAHAWCMTQVRQAIGQYLAARKEQQNVDNRESISK